MTDFGHQFCDIEAQAARISVAMLDTLLDASASGFGGFDAARYAADLKRLGDDLAQASGELERLLMSGESTRAAASAAA